VGDGGTPGPTIREAARFGEVVLIAVLYGVLPDLGRELEPGLAGKIVLDACNPYPPDPETFRNAIQDEGVAPGDGTPAHGSRWYYV
jgi:predicted dinucleotide-binding enzyme